jgi:hypothetical protein
MSTAVELSHPIRADEVVRVECDPAPRFDKVLEKASRGWEFFHHDDRSANCGIIEVEVQ